MKMQKAMNTQTEKIEEELNCTRTQNLEKQKIDDFAEHYPLNLKTIVSADL